MAKPPTLDGPSYRRTSRSNSPSSSSVITVRPLDSSRSRSGSRKPSKVLTAGSEDGKPSFKRPTSSSTRLSSSGSIRQSDKAAAEGTAGYSRWSQSSNSTHATNEHRRHSSFSKRFSFGTAQLAAPQQQNASKHRTTSPSKKRRPVDIQTGLSTVRNTKATGQGDQLSVPGNLGAPKILMDAPYDGPRTPLLYMGQISSNDDVRISHRFSESQGAANADYHGTTQGSSKPNWDATTTAATSTAPRQQPTGTSRHSNAQSQGESERNSSGSQNQESSPVRTKLRGDRDKKTILARALQRANDAVQLDNAQDYMGAVEAYEEACEYLGQVLNKSSSEDDKRKLTTIRETYSSRIGELQQLGSQWRVPEIRDTGAKKEDHKIGEGRDVKPSLDGTIDQEEAPAMETATARDYMEYARTLDEHQSSNESQSGETGYIHQRIDSDLQTGQTSSHKPIELAPLALTDATKLAPPSRSDVPPPLSPRRPPPPVPTTSTTHEVYETNDVIDDYDPRRESHLIGAEAGSHESWLDNGQPSPGGASESSSHHSMSSVNGLRRKHLRVHSSSTEAEFDAALDAAVEAAYDEGYEPYVEADAQQSRDYLARASMIAPQTRPDEYYAQRNSIIAAANAHVAIQGQVQHGRHSSAQFSEPISEMDSDEEERLLDQATRKSMGDDSTVDTQAKANPPRQSDSSTSSGRTWGSSVASSLNTTGTSLTTVDEYATTGSSNFKQLPSIPPPAPPPTGALPSIPGTNSAHSTLSAKAPPALPMKATRNLPTLTLPQSPSVQDRRSSSGQGAKRLKIETAVGPKPELKAPDQGDLTLSIPKRAQPELPPKTAPGAFNSDNRPSPRVGGSQGQSAPSSYRLISSPFPTPFQCQFPDDISSNISAPTSSITPSLTPAFSNDSGSIRPSPQSASPINPFQNRSIDSGLMQSHSSLSLRPKGLLTPESYDNSPGTPMSFTFGAAHTTGRPALLNASSAVTFAANATPPSINSINFLANETSGAVQYPPRPLEPCPASELRRPFWLMRRFYQTLAHPRGGYLSNKIFIPREVWKVKNVKLKNVDDKIANCDLLTAALLKLGTVDTLDADAVLEEMQAFESVLEQAQTHLSKKLGNDVGVQNISSLFKDAPATSASANSNDGQIASVGDTTSGGADGNAGKSNSKSYFSSWRKLRSKNSSAALGGSMPVPRDTISKESVTMSTIPMTSAWPGASNRAAKREPGQTGGDIKTDGPNASYMSALTRLCDAVQVLDHIARQVEDPGLKHSSPTHVGLELSSRHAAEFFGFYICRFVLQDIAMMAEKFVKRASEWVLS